MNIDGVRKWILSAFDTNSGLTVEFFTSLDRLVRRKIIWVNYFGKFCRKNVLMQKKTRIDSSTGLKQFFLWMAE